MVLYGFHVSFQIAHALYRPFLRPCITNGILAPTVNQRLTYGSWLHVYAKSRCQLLERMAQLTDLYIMHLSTPLTGALLHDFSGHNG